MKMIKNRLYKKFLTEGDIRFIEPEDFKKLIENINGIRGKYKDQARVLVAILYYTGARPNEALRLYQGDITKKGAYIFIKMPGSKKGVTRSIPLRVKNYYVKEIYKYCWNAYPRSRLFRNFITKHIREYKTKSGEIKYYKEITGKFRYHFYRWSGDMFGEELPPYYLRHNRFSKLMTKGATAEEIRIQKGGRSLESVSPYLHFDSKTLKKIARIND